MFTFSALIVDRLTYKYHRLVASSDRPGELPQVEKCVVDDDEEDEEEVRLFVFLPGLASLTLGHGRVIFRHFRKLSEGSQ